MHRKALSKTVLLSTSCILALSLSFAARAQEDSVLQDNAAQELLNRTADDAIVNQLKQRATQEDAPLDTEQAANSIDSNVLEQLPSEQKLLRLREQIAANPNNLDNYFAFAQTAAALGQLESAVTSYETMLSKDPTLDRVRLDLGATYLRMGNLQAAQTELQTVLDRDPPEQVRNNINSILSQIDGELREHFIGGSVSTGLNLDSNGNSAASADKILIFDTEIPLRPDQQEQQDLQFFASASLYHNYTPLWAKTDSLTTSWKSLAAYYQTEQSSLESLDLKVLSFKTGPEFRLNESGLKLSPSIGYNHITLDGHTYLRNGLVELNAEYPINQSVQIYGGTKREKRDFVNAPNVNTYTDRTGDATQFDLGTRWIVTDADFLDFQLTHRREETRREYYDNEQLGGSVSYTKLFPYDIFSQARLGYRDTRYDGSDFLISSKTRHDKEKTAALTIGKKINDTVSATIGYQYRDVDSNILNYDYDNHRFSASLSARF